jgi:zinc D-Ala-D-Ala carboxypeptidase
MRLTKNFTLEEFEFTRHIDIDNSLPTALMENALRTCQMLEKIRAHLTTMRGKPVAIVISSGYRCKQLNDAVGSSDTSHHLKALAADWNARQFGGPYEVCKALEPYIDELGIGQLIHEYGRWIHTSAEKPRNAANRIITISKKGTFQGINRV